MSSREENADPTTVGTTILGSQVPIQRYYDHSMKTEVNAVFHQDYRHVWMTNYPSTLYVYPRQAGKRKDDGTCYYDRHYSWGSARDEWPDLCFQYLPDYDRKSNTKPGQLFTQEGWLVLDLYRKPIYDFRMPLALSSKTESFLLEAMLRDNYDLGIQVQDIRARMPGDQRKDGIRSATLSMQMSRWRAIAGCISWAPGRTASDTIRHYLDALLPQECLEANSTRGFRDLFPFEVQEMSLLNVGNFPQKARTANRNFSDKNKHKQKKFAEAVKKYEKLRMAHDGRDELTEAYHKAVATRAEREGRQDEETDIGDLVSIDGDNLEDSDNEKEYRPIKRRKTNRSVSNVGPRHDARHNSDDSENEEEYIPIFETSRPVLNTRPRRDARHAAALQNPDIEPKEYSSDDSEDYGSVPEDNPRFHRNQHLHEARKTARKVARQNKDGKAQSQSLGYTEDDQSQYQIPGNTEEGMSQCQTLGYTEEGKSQCQSPWYIEDGKSQCQSPWYIEDGKSQCQSPGYTEDSVFNSETWAQCLNPCKSQIPSIDFRTLFPTTDEHLELTQIFLAPSRHHFKLLTGSDPPSVDPNSSYKVQYEHWQTALDQWMHAFVPESEGTLLIGLLELTDLGYKWNSPWIEDHMGEQVDMAYAQSCAFVIKLGLGRFRT